MNKQKIQTGGFGKDKTKEMLNYTAKMIAQNEPFINIKKQAANVNFNRNIDEKNANGLWDYTTYLIDTEFGNNANKITNREYLHETIYNLLWERLEETRSTIGKNYEVIIVRSPEIYNSIIFQLIVEKERVDYLMLKLEKDYDYYYAEIKDNEDNEFDSVWDYLEYIIEQEDGIIVNELFL